MPLYCYSYEGTVLTELFPMGKAPQTLRRKGVTYERDLTAEGRGGRNATAPWPMYSEALGVGHDQVKEAEADAAANGIPTKFTPDGRAILESPSHRKRLAELYGFYDRNSYGTKLEATRR